MKTQGTKLRGESTTTGMAGLKLIRYATRSMLLDWQTDHSIRIMIMRIMIMRSSSLVTSFPETVCFPWHTRHTKLLFIQSTKFFTIFQTFLAKFLRNKALHHSSRSVCAPLNLYAVRVNHMWLPVPPLTLKSHSFHYWNLCNELLLRSRWFCPSWTFIQWLDWMHSFQLQISTTVLLV